MTPPRQQAALASEVPVSPPPEDVVRVPRSLPRGRHALPRKVVLLSQRERLLEGIVEAVAEKGYGKTSVSDITRHAGVSRTTFYEVFDDKEDCFLAAYEDGAAKHLEYIAEASLQHEGWLDQFRAGTRAYLRFLSDRPDWSRTFLTEISAGGPRAMELRREVFRRYAQVLQFLEARLREEQPDLPSPPDEVHDAAVAAVNEVVVQWIEQDRMDELDELEPTITFIHLSLLGIADEAAKLFPAA
jgi:AcrR family transcriptional regulator